MAQRDLQQSQLAHSRFFYGYIIVIASFMIMLAIFGTRYAFGVFFKPMVNEFYWSNAVTAGAFSLSMAMEGILAVVMGWLTDRLGPRIVLTIAGVTSAAGYLALYWTNSVWQFYLFYAVVGIGAGCCFVPILATVPRWFLKKRSTMTGLVLCGIGIGTLIASPISNWLITILNWRMSFLIMGIVVLVVVVSAAQFLRRDPAEQGILPFGSKVSLQKAGTWGLTVRQAVVTRQFWDIFSIFFAYGLCTTAIMVYVVPYAIDIQISPATAASLLATIGAVAIVGRLIMGPMADRIGNKQSIIIGLVIMSAMMLLLIFSASLWMLYVFAVFFGFAYGCIGPAQSPVVAECFGLKHHGQVFGVVDSGFTLGAAMGPFIFGLIIDKTNSYMMAFAFSLVLCVIGIISAVILKPGLKKSISLPTK